MIMNNKKVLNEESQWEMMEVQFKLKTLMVMHHLMENNITNNFTHAILIVIENLQTIYFMVHPSLVTLWNTQFYQYMLESLQYFQVNYIMATEGTNMLIVVLYVTFIILLLWTAIWFYLCWKLDGSNTSSTFMSFLLKYYSMGSQILLMALSLPMYDAIISVIWCQPAIAADRDFICYAGTHILHLIVAVVCMVLLTCYVIIFTFYFVDYNPSTKGPYIGVQADTMILNLIMKFGNPFMIIFNSYGGFTQEYIPFMAIVYSYALYMRYSQAPQYNNFIYWYTIIVESTTLWVSLNANFVTFFTIGGVDDMGFCFMFVGLPLFLFTCVDQFRKKNSQVLSKGLEGMRNEDHIDFYLHTMYVLISQRDQAGPRIKLFGLLKDHYSRCKNKYNCSCKELIHQSHWDEESPEARRNWYRLYRSIIEELLDGEFEKCSRIHLQYAYLANDKLGNPYKALYELMVAEDNKPTWREEFSIFRYKTQIEHQMAETDAQDVNSALDVGKIVYFQNQYALLSHSIEKSVEYHLEFWREIQEDNPSIQKLQNLGSKILNSVTTCSKYFEELCQVNNNHIKCQELYTYFMLEVVNNEDEGQRLKEKAQIYRKQFTQKTISAKSQQQQSQSIDQQMCVICVSGNHNSLGTVVSCSNEIVEMLEFYQSDLVGQNIGRIMPKAIQESHDYIMKRFLDSSQSKILGQERLVFPQTKSMYVVPTHITIKVLPNLTKGIQMVGFLKPIDLQYGEHYLIYDASNFQVHGVTESLYSGFGLSSDIVFGAESSTEFSLDLIFKDLVEQLANKPENFDLLYKSGTAEGQGIETVLDSTLIPQIFIQPYQAENDGKKYNISSQTMINDEMRISFNESLMQKLFRRTKVRVQLVEETIIGEQLLHTIFIREIPENEEEFLANRMMTESVMKKKREMKFSNQMTMRHDIKEEIREEMDSKQSRSRGNNQQFQEDKQDIEDQKTIRDFKQIILQRATPSKIKILNYLTYALLLSLLGLSIAKLVVAMDQGEYVHEGIQAISNSYQRHSLMADINFFSRQLQLLGTGSLQVKDVKNWEKALKTNLTVIILNLQQLQFLIIQNQIALNQRTTIDTNVTYPIEFLLQTNMTKIYNNIFNDAIFQFITSASTLAKGQLSSFTQADQVADTQKSLYFVVRNGLYVLREGSELIAQQFYDFYLGQENYQDGSIIILAVGIVFITIIVTAFLPIVFGLKQEMVQIVSIYGKVPTEHIKEIIQKGDQFLKEFIEKYTDKQDDFEDEDAGAHVDVVKTKKKYLEIANDQDQVDEIGDPDSKDLNSSSKKNSQLNFGIDRHRQFLIKDKSQKLYESQNISRMQTLLQFSFGAALLMTEFVVMYTIEQNFTDGIQTSFKHLRLSAQRSSGLKYDLLFTMEQIVENGKVPTFKKKNMTDEYYQRVFDNEESYFNSLALTYPSALDGYFALFANINYFDLCEVITWIDNPVNVTDEFIFVPYDEGDFKMSQAPKATELRKECSKLSGGIMQKGLRIGIYLVNSNCGELRDAISNADDPAAKRLELVNSKNYRDLQQMMKFIVPSIMELHKFLQSELKSYIDNQTNIQIYNFIAFIGFLLLSFLCVWRPYMSATQETIWKTNVLIFIVTKQAMLSFIPIDLLQKCPPLKEALQDVLRKGITTKNKYQ